MSPIPLGIFAASGAAAPTGAFDLLETTLISSNTASVTFSNLDNYSDYKHLQIRFTAKAATTADNIRLTLNGDTSSNYTAHYLGGNGTNVASVFAGANGNYMDFVNTVEQSTTANAFSAGVLDLLDFSSSNKNTTVGLFNGRVGGVNNIYLHSGLWMSTNNVTSITLTSNGAYVSGSRFSLYGIKG